MKRQLRIGGTVALAVLLCGFSCSVNSYAKAGKLAKDFAASVLVAQQVEAQAYRGGFVDNDKHLVIQQKFSQIADAGMSLDKAINVDHNASGAVAQISALNGLLQDLSTNLITGIKDDKSRVAVQATLVTVQSILDSISAFGGK